MVNAHSAGVLVICQVQHAGVIWRVVPSVACAFGCSTVEFAPCVYQVEALDEVPEGFAFVRSAGWEFMAFVSVVNVCVTGVRGDVHISENDWGEA